MRIARSVRWLAVLLTPLLLACSSASPAPADSAAAADRADYAVFAHRCSKCHSLSRPLDSGIDDDEYWKRYVERMRRMPSSGISHEDEVPILRFLHRYSLEQAAKKSGALSSLSDGGR